MKITRRPASYRKELRDQAVRHVLEIKGGEYPSEFTAITSNSRKLGIGLGGETA